MRVSKKKCEEAIEIPEQREILQTLLEHSNSLGHTELRRKAGIQSDEVFDKHLAILVENRLVLSKRMLKVHKQKVFHTVNPEAKPILRRLLTPSIVRSVLERFRLLSCRDPDQKEVARAAGITPDEADKELHKLAPKTRWKPPAEQERLLGKHRAYRRLELAAWIKLGCRDAVYLRREWPEEEFKKAERILARYPEYVPEMDAYRRPEDSNERFHYRLCLPEVAWEVTGATDLYSDLKVPKVLKGQVPKHIVVLGLVRTVLTKDFGPCIDKVKIQYVTDSAIPS